MPNLGDGRSNYRVEPNSVVTAKGYGSVKFSHFRVMWDAMLEGDPGFVDIDETIDEEILNAMITGLNNGKIEDRWDVGN